jgi:hypothetical protein
VQIQVSLTVDVPPSGGLDGVEQAVLAAGRQAMVEAMRVACRVVEEQTTACPHCGGADLRSEGTDRRVLLCVFGRVALAPRRWRCHGCGRRFRPAAPWLAGLHGANVTPALAEVCVLAGTSWAYAAAARVVRQLCGAAVSAETVRALTAAAGTAEQRAQQAAAEAVVAPTAAQVRAQDAAERARRPARRAPAAPPAPARLLVGLDGGWVASRDQPGGMEGKVGVVATGVAPVGQDRQRLTPRRYVATFGSSQVVGTLAYAAAVQLGGDRAREQTVLGDGAEWIKTQAARHFPEAVAILDWSHVARAVHKAIRAARPGRERRAERRELHRTIPAHLWHGRVDAALAALTALRPAPAAEPIKALEEAITYLQHQRAWLGDYAAWQAAGYPVGSGMVEREVDLLINRRMKRRGMRWRRANADAVVALRVREYNATWDETSTSRPLAA